MAGHTESVSSNYYTITVRSQALKSRMTSNIIPVYDQLMLPEITFFYLLEILLYIVLDEVGSYYDQYLLACFDGVHTDLMMCRI